MGDTLGALLRALQSSGLSMDAGQAMDSLWLALRIGERSGVARTDVPDEGARRVPPAGAQAPLTTPPASTSPGSTPPVPVRPSPASAPHFALLDEEVDALDSVEGRWIALERTSALAMGRELSRALRPLRRRVQVPGRGRLDVEATVRRMIDEFVFLPTFLPARERWLDVLLVLDHGLSMIVWKETLDAFERLLRTSGAFRSVRSFWLETDTPEPAITTRARSAQARLPSQLPAIAQSRSRSVALVVSDCVSPRWHDGAVPGLLAAWGASLPVSLLQVTPDWYWPRTALGDAAEGPLFATGELTPNSRLSWSSTAMGVDGLLPEEAGPFAPVPLAAMTAHDIGRLARLLAGGGEGGVRGALFDLSWRGEERQGGALTPESRVARFHTLATADARRLAAAFASSPIQTLGMLRLLRRDLLPGSKPFVEAEVLLGGLLRVRAEDASWDAGAALRLEFFEGVRALLQDSATVPDILRVLRHASRDAGAGRSATFSAWLSEPELRESGLEELGETFASVAAPVLQRLGGSYARGVQRMVGRTAPAAEEGVPRDEPGHSEAKANAGSLDVGAEGDVSAEDPAAGSAERREQDDAASSGATSATPDLRVMRARAVPSATRFVGRENEVEWLLSIARGGRGNSVRIAWIHGAEGLGKSALVAELVRTWNARFSPDDAFYWSFAPDSSAELWLRTLTDVASKSDLGTNADLSELRAALLGALADSRRTLLVLDSVDRLDGAEWERIRDTLSLLARSLGSNLSIVIASRAAPDEELSVSPLHLAPLPPDAIKELIERTADDPRLQGARSRAPGGASAEARDASELLASLAGGNPGVLLSLMELFAIGHHAEELRDLLVPRDGTIAPLSVPALRAALQPFHDAREVRGLLASADASASDGKLSDALADAERALGVAERIGVERRVGAELIARSLEAMGKLNVRLGKPEEGMSQLQRALDTAAKGGAGELAESLRHSLAEYAPQGGERELRAIFHVYGRVAGVFFRSWTQQQARELQLEATAENLPDGRIRVTATGSRSALDALEQRLRTGPRGATVTRVTREGADIGRNGADVFLSYAAADREITMQAGEALRANGLTVYLDDASMRGGDAWQATLAAALDRAGCIVVMLSRAAIASDWVQREYRRGLEKQNLVVAMVDRRTPIPNELEQLSFADLTTWDRSVNAPAFRSLLAAVLGVIAGEPVRTDTGVDSSDDAPAEDATNPDAPAEQRPDDVTGDVVSQTAGATAASADGSLPSGATSAFDVASLDLRELEGPGWVQLPGGTFRMGATDGEERERPEHTVSISEFRISRFPITNRQYERFLKETGITPPAHWRGGRLPSGTRDHPVTNVNWHDASAYCSWLSSQLASTHGGSVQLPTEAQWEYAARGGQGRLYPWGDAPPTKEHANYGRRSSATRPVNAHAAGVTPTGIWDMVGNAWEWCRDWFGAYPSGTSVDPVGPSRGTVRVIRGGSYQSEATKLRAAYRANRPPNDVFDRGGFRVVWTAPAPSATSSR